MWITRIKTTKFNVMKQNHIIFDGKTDNDQEYDFGKICDKKDVFQR